MPDKLEDWELVEASTLKHIGIGDRKFLCKSPWSDRTFAYLIDNATCPTCREEYKKVGPDWWSTPHE